MVTCEIKTLRLIQNFVLCITTGYSLTAKVMAGKVGINLVGKSPGILLIVGKNDVYHPSYESVVYFC